MNDLKIPALILGLALVAGFGVLGLVAGDAAIAVKELERTVTVKGLSEREVAADIMIWPITFTEASNDLGDLYRTLELGKKTIEEFLLARGVNSEEISFSQPAITDKLAQQYGGGPRADFRYVAQQTVTVYSKRVEAVREVMPKLSQLGASGIAIAGADYQNQVEFLFSRLNDIKPEMVQEATAKARQVALEFARDSNSQLGKIRKASQGQFSIEPRDKNNPHLKQIRVVSTIEYYLTD